MLNLGVGNRLWRRTRLLDIATQPRACRISAIRTWILRKNHATRQEYDSEEARETHSSNLTIPSLVTRYRACVSYLSVSNSLLSIWPLVNSTSAGHPHGRVALSYAALSSDGSTSGDSRIRLFWSGYLIYYLFKY